MGFLKSLGKSIVKGITQGTNEGLNKLISTATQYTTSGSASSLFRSPDYSNKYTSYTASQIRESDFRTKDSNLLKDNYTFYSNSFYFQSTESDSGYNSRTTNTNYSNELSTSTLSFSNDLTISKYVKDDMPDWLVLETPDWTYGDLINERAMFQKGISSLLNDPLYCYFKIFFKFNTNYGLLGGIIANSATSGQSSIKYVTNNTARKYLSLMDSGVSKAMYRQERPRDRSEALCKFVKLLSYISTNAPWMFKGVKGLQEAETPRMTDFTKEKAIEIEMNPDAIDMKLTTLFSLYRYACYDTINCKEIIPDNLRKFDMMISVFSMPLRHLHTSTYDSLSGTKYSYKSMSPINKNWSNVMSYRMYTFRNCEIDVNSLGSLYGGTMSNDNPFQLASATMKINYDRCYVSHCNEFYGLAFGDDGFYNNQYDAFLLSKNSIDTNDTEKRISSLVNAWQSSTKNAIPEAFSTKAIVDASEALATNNLIKVQGYNMGNIYGEKNVIGTDSYYGYTSATSLGSGIHREYYKTKLDALKNGTLGSTSMHDIITNNGNYNVQSTKIWKNLGSALKNAWNSGAY